jgi:outer membrane protein assembly factor BamB
MSLGYSFIGLTWLLSGAVGLHAGGQRVAAPDASDPVVWPQWRGPSRDGRVEGTAWPDRLTADRLSAVWRVDNLGPSYAGPIVGDSLVYTVETRDKQHEIVRAFDRASGEFVWSAQWEGAMDVPFFAAKNGSWIRSTPAWDGERLYVGGMRDVLVCLDARTGAQVWAVDFLDRFESPLPAFGLVCSPLVTSDHVYIQAGAALVKLDKRTGETIWRSLQDEGGMNGSAFSSPIIATIGGVEQVVVQTREELCGVQPADGRVLWRERIKTFRGMNILTPTVLGDHIFTSAYGGRSVLLRACPPADQADWLVQREWDNGVQGYMTSPVIIDGYAYMYTRSNRFACIDLQTGQERWISAPTGDDYWSIVSQGDRILALSDDGVIRLIRADPTSYDIIDELAVASQPTWAHLAVAGDELVIREQTALAVHRWK